MNAHRWLFPLTLPLLISGCSLFGGWNSVEPITINKKAVEKTRLDLPLPTPFTAKEINWVVVTPENASKVFAELKEKNIDVVLFAITDEGYEQLAVTMAELRNIIAQQRAVIIKYKEYYEPEKTPDNKASK